MAVKTLIMALTVLLREILEQQISQGALQGAQIKSQSYGIFCGALQGAALFWAPCKAPKMLLNHFRQPHGGDKDTMDGDNEYAAGGYHGALHS